MLMTVTDEFEAIRQMKTIIDKTHTFKITSNTITLNGNSIKTKKTIICNMNTDKY